MTTQDDFVILRGMSPATLSRAYDPIVIMSAARKRRRSMLKQFHRGVTQRELAIKYGISIQRVSQILAEARREV